MISKLRVLFFALLTALLGGVSFSSAAFSFPSTQVPDSPTISLKSRTFAPEPGIEPALQNQLQQVDGNWHGLIQLTQIPNQAQREELAEAGIELLSYIPDNAWLASLPADLGAVQSLAYVNWVGRLLPEDKVSSAIREGNFASWATNSDDTVTVWVDLFEDVSLEEARRLIEDEGGTVTTEIAELSRLIADVPPELVGLLATSDMVQWIDQEPPAKEAHNDGIRKTISADPVQIAPYNLSGAGVQAAMWDAGAVDPAHPGGGSRIPDWNAV